MRRGAVGAESPLRRGAGNERVAIIGLGASGEAAARLALLKGAEVHVTDAKSEPAAAARGALLRERGAEIRLGGHDLDAIAAADTVVVSPGIPPSAPVLAALRARGVAWVSEPDFAGRFIASPLTVVTGTNGKTTTATLSAHLLREAGVEVLLGGNVGEEIGPPASQVAVAEHEAGCPADRVVLELSSFQLADTTEMTPDVGVMTNLGVDHLDRYGSVEEYHRDKRRLFELGDETTTWVLNGDDDAVIEMAEGAPGTHLRFSLESTASPGSYLADGHLVVDLGERADSVPLRVAARSDLRLPGRHNLANALAAILATAAAGVPLDSAAHALGSFVPLPHRLESLGSVAGVRWVNDSKATNVAATASSLESLASPVVLLLGGADKGEDFRALAPALRGRVRAVVAYGAAGERAAAEVEAATGGRIEVRRVAGTFAEAVSEGARVAVPGETLLLAPACSSFDIFASYRDRGEAFRALAEAARR